MQIGILVYPGVADLDVAVPAALLAEAGRLERGRGSGREVHTATIARTLDYVPTEAGLKIIPGASFANAPSLDALLVPGGLGRLAVEDSAEALDWVRRAAADAQMTAGLSTGTFILAKAGLLTGKRATTHSGWIEDLRRLDSVVASTRRVEADGHVVTCGGGAAVLDGSLRIVQELLGPELADLVSASVQYAPLRPAEREAA